MDEIAKAVVLGFPSFVGLLYCIYIQKQQNDRLMALIERLCKDCAEDGQG